MIWNHVLQATFGYLACDALQWSRSGILLCALVTSALQGIDTFRFYKGLRNRFASDFVAVEDGRFAAFQRESLYKFGQLFVFKVLWYGGISMAVATIAR
ncbi:MAG: hypothetical protein HY912_21490 [Desulfomonile tiedjei]|uniref:Uncharacterized protein n=1 Tax=Desulfomonile tiedjei TaxID=2358 RepID=A0A9D6V5T3_9BACT|nr:hypothetical protein [Desulfomonile tiedjei]